MSMIKQTRRALGLVTVVVLLVMVLGDFFYESLTLEPKILYVLLALISSLLGMDMIGERVLSVTLTDKEDQ